MQIIIAQHEPQHLERKKITAARVAENVAPAAGPLDSPHTTAGNRSAGPSIDGDAVAVPEGRGESRVAIAAGNDRGARPDLRAKLRQFGTICFRAASRQKCTDSFNFARQFAKDGPDLLVPR